MTPSPEQFEQWRASPVTEWFMAFLQSEMTRTQNAYFVAAWAGDLAEVQWMSKRERYETLDWVRTLDMPTIEMIRMQDVE